MRNFNCSANKYRNWDSELLGLCFLRPFYALGDSGAMRSIALFGIAGILHQKLARNISAFTAVYDTFVLATYCNRAFTMERMPVRFDTSAAAARLLILTSSAVKSTS